MNRTVARLPRLANELGAWALRRRHWYRVTGTSMVPVLADGEVILIDPGRAAAPGTIVVCRHPWDELTLVKTVTAVDDDGFVHVDSPAGSGSRTFGRVAPGDVLGVATVSLSRRRIVGEGAACLALRP